jgi:hypothetical protein
VSFAALCFVCCCMYYAFDITLGLQCSVLAKRFCASANKDMDSQPAVSGS